MTDKNKNDDIGAKVEAKEIAKADDAVDFIRLGFKDKNMYEFPNIVNIEVYRGECVCKCVHCPVGTTEPEDRKERFGYKEMDLGLYKKIVSEIAEHPHSTVRIHSVGEPLLWADVAEAMKYAKDNSVRSWIFTCAALKDDALLESICANTDVVEVSVNSTSSEDYKATKGIAAFDLVCRNIGHMHDYIASHGLDTRLIASRVQSLDKDKDDEFVRLWKSSGKVDDAFVRSYHTYNDVIAELPLEGAEHKHDPCLVHWGRFNISVYGEAVVCFNELFKKHLDPALVYGDMHKVSIADIWHGEKMTVLRASELSGDYSDPRFGDNLPCKDCYSCQPLFGNRETSENQIKCKKGG